jgi:hypothetical protein
MAEFKRKSKPTDFNPNILLDMATRSAEDFIKNHSPFEERHPEVYDESERTTATIPFAKAFEEGYQKALETLALADPKGKITKGFKVAPIAPRLDLHHGDKGADVLAGSKMRGVPDLRRRLQSSIHHNQHAVEHSNGVLRSPAELLRYIWPKDANGDYMLFASQVVVRPDIAMPWDYFSREKTSQWNDYIATFEESSRGDSMAPWVRQFQLFISTHAPHFDPRLDCAKLDECWFEGPHSREKPLMDEDAYLAILTEAIPQACSTHMDDEAQLWSLESRPIERMELGFDIDIIDSYDWHDAPVTGFSEYDLHEAWEEAGLRRTGNGQMFGAPRSQQSLKRYPSPQAWGRVYYMRPWMSWNDPDHDFTWQLNYAMKGHEMTAWGKVDGSCT